MLKSDVYLIDRNTKAAALKAAALLQAVARLNLSESHTIAWSEGPFQFNRHIMRGPDLIVRVSYIKFKNRQEKLRSFEERIS